MLAATVTVTFGAIKSGLLHRPARDFAGRIVLIDIGLAPALASVEPVLKLEEQA